MGAPEERDMATDNDRSGRQERDARYVDDVDAIRVDGRLCGENARHVDGLAAEVANPVDDEIQPSGGAIGTPRPGWK